MADNMNDQNISTDQTDQTDEAEESTQTAAAIADVTDPASTPQSDSDDSAAPQGDIDETAGIEHVAEPTVTQQDAGDREDAAAGDEQIIDADVVALFETRLMEDLGFAGLPPEEEKSVKDKIEEIVNNRIINLMMIYMPEDKLKDFEVVIQQNDDQKTVAFVEENIPNWSDKVMSELLQLKDDLIGSK